MSFSPPIKNLLYKGVLKPWSALSVSDTYEPRGHCLITLIVCKVPLDFLDYLLQTDMATHLEL